ncbi:hypothetical protein CYMTET_3549 [Cymbomonas tetramitiformis]|uniref:Uncharacterized protein n=1 Tax=Cymbomonas tetramitiformis TaxID=36881 RepID=A0AAE0H346_9CHLO|nr:hypothetical protein CYMTET_3549 [Cymbomonas tetramitiformis]
MDLKERSIRELDYKNGPYPDLAYHVPVRVAKEGFYQNEGVKEHELLTLFERITGYIRRGERLTRWLCETAERILAEVKKRVYSGHQLLTSSPDELREVHECVVGAVTGVATIRSCTLHTREAQHAYLHTRSEAFAGLIQMIVLLRQRWDSDDRRLCDVETQLRLYVNDLCETSGCNDKERCSKIVSVTRQTGNYRPRRSLLDSFLDIITGTNMIKWTRKDAAVESVIEPVPPSPKRIDAYARTKFEESEIDFMDVLLRCVDHPLEYEQEVEVYLHGIYHETNKTNPIAALPPIGTTKIANTRIRISKWCLNLTDVYPQRVPVKDDRLCRRRYRAIPLQFSSPEQTNSFLNTYVRMKCDVTSRCMGLSDLCPRSASCARVLDQIMCDRFDAEVACMHDERNSLSMINDTFAGMRSGFMELVFWLREFLDGQQRWVDPKRICRERLPKAWTLRQTSISSVWADVFVIFPDEFRIAFKYNQKGISNCVGIEKSESYTNKRYVRYTLRTKRGNEKAIIASLQNLLSREWYACFDKNDELVIRIEEGEKHAAEIAIGFDNINTYQSEPIVCDVSEAVFVPGAVFSVASMGKFVQFLFWSLLQSMSTDTNRPWSGLVPVKPLNRLPMRVAATSRSIEKTMDSHKMCMADPCWREYVMWVTVELQRIALCMRSSGMSPRIAGAGLGVMASSKIYGGETVASAIKTLNQCRTERTKQVVRPNSYLNTRSLSLLDNIGCTYFPFDSEKVMDQCVRSTGFIKAPGYDSKKYPYLYKVFVDSKGDLRDDVPMCFASPIITPSRFSDTVRDRYKRSGYLHVDNHTSSDVTLRSDLRFMRMANFYDAPKCPALLTPKLNRRDGSTRDDRANRSVVDRIELFAHRATVDRETDPALTHTSSDDIHSSQSVGVVGAHISRCRGAQFATRFVFRDGSTEKAESRHRLCLEDSHRRVSMGFCELGTDFWTDISNQGVLLDEAQLVLAHGSHMPDNFLSSQTSPNVLRSYRRVLVFNDRLSYTKPLLESLGWTQTESFTPRVCVFTDVKKCTRESTKQIPSSLRDRMQYALQKNDGVRSLAREDDDGNLLDAALLTLALRYQVVDAITYVQSVCANSVVAKLRKNLLDRICEECEQIGQRLDTELREKVSSGKSDIDFVNLLEAIRYGIVAGKEQAQALALSPRVMYRWLQLTGNAFLILKCSSVYDGLYDDCRIVQSVLQYVHELIRTTRLSHHDDNVHLKAWTTIDCKQHHYVGATVDWIKHAKACAAYIAAFFPHEDLLHGALDTQSPIDSSGNENSGHVKQGNQRARCNRQQLHLIMQSRSSASLKDTEAPEFVGIDRRYIWVNVLADLLRMFKNESDECSDRAIGHNTNSQADVTIEEDPCHTATLSSIGMNDICYDHVRTYLRHTENEHNYTDGHHFHRYTVDMCIKVVGDPVTIWVERLEAVSNPIGKTYDGIFSLLILKIPEELQRDLEKRIAGLHIDQTNKVLLELAMRDQMGTPLSTRTKPFRFLVDDLLFHNSYIQSLSAHTERIWFPTSMRCDLVTNERRVIRGKEGAAGMLTSEHGRLVSFTFMISTLLLVRDLVDI